MQEETYELPILDGLEDGSSAGETITVKEDLNTTYKTLKVIHSIKSKNEENHYSFSITNVDKQICSYEKSYKNSPDSPPNRVIQAIDKFGYYVKENNISESHLGSLQIMDEIVDILHSTYHTYEDDKLEDRLTKEQINYALNSSANFRSCIMLYQSINNVGIFEELQEKAIKNIELNGTEEINEIINILQKDMVDMARNEGYIDDNNDKISKYEGEI